jgi:hypothetical protein
VAAFRSPVCFMNFGLIPDRHRYCTYLYYSSSADSEFGPGLRRPPDLEAFPLTCQWTIHHAFPRGVARHFERVWNRPVPRLRRLEISGQ